MMLLCFSQTCEKYINIIIQWHSKPAPQYGPYMKEIILVKDVFNFMTNNSLKWDCRDYYSHLKYIYLAFYIICILYMAYVSVFLNTNKWF